LLFCGCTRQGGSALIANTAGVVRQLREQSGMARQRKFVLTKIDKTLAWEQWKEAERDTRFVELGAICVRCGRGNTGGWRS
jgi:hypothetical protein